MGLTKIAGFETVRLARSANEKTRPFGNAGLDQRLDTPELDVRYERSDMRSLLFRVTHEDRAADAFGDFDDLVIDLTLDEQAGRRIA